MRELKSWYISGSNGFIGSKLVDQLEQSGREVIRGDREGTLPRQVDVIVHCASYGNYHDQTDVRKIYQANLGILTNLLEAGEHFPYQAFVVIGSSSEYGRQSRRMDEDTTVPQPNTVYGAAKLAATSLAQAWARKHEKPITVLRPFSVTGPSEQERHLIPTLIKSAVTGAPMTLDPHPSHDYVDVRDVVKAIQILVEQPSITGGEVYNCGSGIQYTNRAVSQLVEQETGKKINFTPSTRMRSYDSDVWVADNRKLKSLGWTPEYNLRQSIKDMVFMREERPQWTKSPCASGL